jgi:hypothetical protein
MTQIGRGTLPCAIIVPMDEILKSDASFDVDPKGIFNRKIVALPGPWSVVLRQSSRFQKLNPSGLF